MTYTPDPLEVREHATRILDSQGEPAWLEKVIRRYELARAFNASHKVYFRALAKELRRRLAEWVGARAMTGG